MAVPFLLDRDWAPTLAPSRDPSQRPALQKISVDYLRPFLSILEVLGYVSVCIFWAS